MKLDTAPRHAHGLDGGAANDVPLYIAQHHFSRRHFGQSLRSQALSLEAQQPAHEQRQHENSQHDREPQAHVETVKKRNLHAHPGLANAP